MKLIPLHKNNELLRRAAPLHASWSNHSLQESEKHLTEKLQDQARQLLLFQNDSNYVGFAEVELESECFPDEDLPEVCLKVHAFYVDPKHRKNGLGSAFFHLIKTWGHEQNASLIEMEVPASDQSANSFLQHQGLELIGKGEKNGYRSFL